MQVLTYHIVPQVARASDISNNLVLNTLEASGAKMRMNVYDVVEASGILFGQIQRTVTIFFKVTKKSLNWKEEHATPLALNEI